MTLEVSSNSVRSPFKMTLNVHRALVLRELKTRFGHFRLGYLWIFAEPIAHVAVLSAVFGVRSITTSDGMLQTAINIKR